MLAAEVNEAKDNLSHEALKLSFTVPSTYYRLVLQGSRGGQNGGTSHYQAHQFSIWQKAIWLCMKLTNSPAYLSGWRFFRFNRGTFVNLLTNIIPFIVILVQFIGTVNDLTEDMNYGRLNDTNAEEDDDVNS